MTQDNGNGLPYFHRPSENDYKRAVALIVDNLLNDHGLNPGELADKLGCCARTIKNAKEGHFGLCPVTLGNIRYVFGAEYLKPWDDICDRRYFPAPENTLSDRLGRIEHELDAIRREAA